MALSANREVDRFVDQELRSYQVKGGAHIYKGGLVGVDRSGGYVRALVARDQLAGVAYEEVDNSAGSSGDKSVRVYTQSDFQVALSGATLADVGRDVYASDDETFTFTGTGNSLVGQAIAVPEAGTIILRINAVAGQLPTNLGSVSKSANATLTVDEVRGGLVLGANTAAMSLTLPTAAESGAGCRCTFVKTTDNAFAITVLGDSLEPINGSTTNGDMDAQYDTLTIVSDGVGEWYIVAQNIS